MMSRAESRSSLWSQGQMAVWTKADIYLPICPDTEIPSFTGVQESIYSDKVLS